MASQGGPALAVEASIPVEKSVHVLEIDAHGSGQRMSRVKGQQSFGVAAAEFVDHHRAHATGQRLAVTVAEIGFKHD